MIKLTFSEVDYAGLYVYINLSFLYTILSLFLSSCINDNSVSEVLFLSSMASCIVFILLCIINSLYSPDSFILTIDNGSIHLALYDKEYGLEDVKKIRFQVEKQSLINKTKIYGWGIELELLNNEKYCMKKISDDLVAKLISAGKNKVYYREVSGLKVPFSLFLTNFAVGW